MQVGAVVHSNNRQCTIASLQSLHNQCYNAARLHANTWAYMTGQYPSTSIETAILSPYQAKLVAHLKYVALVGQTSSWWSGLPTPLLLIGTDSQGLQCLYAHAFCCLKLLRPGEQVLHCAKVELYQSMVKWLFKFLICQLLTCHCQ